MRWWLASLVVVLPAVAFADGEPSDAELAAQAERAFRQGVESKTRLLEARKHFAEAANLCRELHQRGVRSPALYRNLGNAAVLADRGPEAIWAYHLGLKLDPNDRAMRDHLAFVRGKVIYPASGKGQPEPHDWPVLLYRPTIPELSVVAASSYLLAWIIGAFAYFRRSPRAYLAAVSGCLVAAASGAALWYATGQADLERQSPLVVVAENTSLYGGNGPSYPPHADVPTLPRGMEVRQQHRRGNWLKVRLSSGEVGWLPRSRVLIVEP